MKFVIAQILIVLVFLAGIIIFFGKVKKKEKVIVAGLCIIAVAASFISNSILGVIPMPKDRIQLTATGEKNSDALNNEVSLKEVIVDDIHYKINNAVEGKWFWKGDSYMWRNENDSRKPEGVTRCITLEIPKGNSRQFVFDNNQYRGIVNITYNGESQTYDLYSEDSIDTTISIPGNGLGTAYLIKFVRLTLFTLFIVVILAYFVFAALKFDYGVIKAWLGRNWDKLYYAAIAVIYIFVMQSVSSDGSLWTDEIWVLGWNYTWEYPREQLNIFSLVFSLWVKIMPYGQEYLMLLSQLFIAAAIYIAGLIGSNFKNKRFGVLLSSIVAFSGSVIYQCSLGTRYFAMMFFSITLIIYLFIKKQNKKNNPKVTLMILYGLSITLAMDVHMMNVTVAGLLMIADFILILFKKTSKKCWFEFICPVIYGLYWIINILPAFLKSDYTYFYHYVDIMKIWDVIKWIFSYNDILIFFAIIGFVLIIVKSLSKLIKKNFDFNKDYTEMTIMLIPFIQMFMIALYSFLAFTLESRGSMFIDRYFVSSFICMFFVLAVGMDSMIDFAGQISKNKGIANIAVAVSVCTMSLYSWTSVSPWNIWANSCRRWNQNYKGAVEYIMKQNDCYANSTIFVLDHINYSNIGIQYYTSHNGERDDINHCSIYELPLDFQNYSTIYVTYWRNDRVNTDFNQIIDEQYKLASNDTTVKVKKYVKKN